MLHAAGGEVNRPYRPLGVVSDQFGGVFDQMQFELSTSVLRRFFLLLTQTSLALTNPPAGCCMVQKRKFFLFGQVCPRLLVGTAEEESTIHRPGEVCPLSPRA